MNATAITEPTGTPEAPDAADASDAENVASAIEGATNTNSKLEQAYQLYVSRKNRATHPHGHFDNARRWYASEWESQDCCDPIRSPSRAFPYSWLVHCRTATHLAQLCDVDLRQLRALIRQRSGTKPGREGGDNYYKAVAVLNGRYLSIYDGVTEYRIGETTSDTARQGHQGGIYCYDNVADAASAQVPRSSKLYYAPRAILRVRAEGRYCRYDGDKLAFSHITPLEVVQLLHDDN